MTVSIPELDREKRDPFRSNSPVATQSRAPDVTHPLQALIDGSARQAAQRSQIERIQQRAFAPQSNPAANTAVVQRMTTDEYIEEVIAQANNRPLWDPRYERDLRATGEYVKYWVEEARAGRFKPKRQVSPADELQRINADMLKPEGGKKDDYKRFVGYLVQNGFISRAQASIMAYADGRSNSHPGRSSLGTLNFNQKSGSFVGRPNFHPNVLKDVKIGPGKHRRHFVAWHNIRKAINKLSQRSDLLDSVEEKLKEQAKHPIVASADALTKSISDRKVRLLSAALYIMNSNGNNLLAGDGRENSAINTASLLISQEVASWQEPEDVIPTITSWAEKPTSSTSDQINVQNAKSEVAHAAWARIFDAGIIDVQGADDWIPKWDAYLKAADSGGFDEEAAENVLTVGKLKAHLQAYYITPLEYDLNDEKEIGEDGQEEPKDERLGLMETAGEIEKTIQSEASVDDIDIELILQLMDLPEAASEEADEEEAEGEADTEEKQDPSTQASSSSSSSHPSGSTGSSSSSNDGI